MTRQHFHEELRGLEASALGGLDLVVEQLDRAMEALEHRDVELAQFVIVDDDRLDGRYLEVHQGVLSLLALQSPVAGDLRLVAALLHVIKHMERMGDQCVNIAKLIPLAGYERRCARRSRPHPAHGPGGALGDHPGQAGVPRCATSGWPRTSSARTARSTASTARSSGSRSRSARRRHARVGDAHGHGRPRARAHRRQRGRRRRADGVRRQRPVPRVLGLVDAGVAVVRPILRA